MLLILLYMMFFFEVLTHALYFVYIYLYSSWRTVKPDGWRLKVFRRLSLRSWRTLRSNWRASASRRAWWAPEIWNEKCKGLISGLSQSVSVCCPRWMSSWLSYAMSGRTWWRGSKKTRRTSTSSCRSTKPSSLRSAGATSVCFTLGELWQSFSKQLFL